VTHLHQEIASRVAAWRLDGYPSPEFPVIAEILDWAPESGTTTLRYLRRPQLQALETYWYLRLVETTPHIADLYRRLYPPDDNVPRLLEALGIPDAAFKAANYSIERLWDRIESDDDFVRDFALDALRETLTLGYPSYYPVPSGGYTGCV
jgi:type III restriction enzyme